MNEREEPKREWLTRMGGSVPWSEPELNLKTRNEAEDSAQRQADWEFCEDNNAVVRIEIGRLIPVDKDGLFSDAIDDITRYAKTRLNDALFRMSQEPNVYVEPPQDIELSSDEIGEVIGEPLKKFSKELFFDEENIRDCFRSKRVRLLRLEVEELAFTMPMGADAEDGCYAARELDGLERSPNRAALTAELKKASAELLKQKDYTGIAARCNVCERWKAPFGRPVPVEMANGLCGDPCPGYRVRPDPGDLWPGEKREDYGQPDYLVNYAKELRDRVNSDDK